MLHRRFFLNAESITNGSTCGCLTERQSTGWWYLIETWCTPSHCLAQGFAGDADLEDESEGEGIEEVTLKRMNHRRHQKAMLKQDLSYGERSYLTETDRRRLVLHHSRVSRWTCRYNLYWTFSLRHLFSFITGKRGRCGGGGGGYRE